MRPLVPPIQPRVRLLLGVPNQITMVRTVLAMTIATIAFRTGDLNWLVAGYAAYWLGDIADGAAARYRHEETVAGAVFDIVCDRACSFLLAAAFMAAYPDVIGPLAIFLVQFGYWTRCCRWRSCSGRARSARTTSTGSTIGSGCGTGPRSPRR
jgi:phosphatidylglycerophosphate synthase